MVCPWLEETDEGVYCTAVSPKVELDFNKPSETDVNGDICKMPAPGLSPTVPWEKCKRYRPK